MADVFQAIVAAIFRQSEADVSGLLPAAADLSELTGQAGQEKNQAAQQDNKGEDQDHRKRGGQVKVVLGWVKSVVPSKDQRVDSGHGQGAVTQRGLQGEKERRQRFVCGTKDNSSNSRAVLQPSDPHLFPLNSQQYSTEPQVTRWPSTADWTLPPCLYSPTGFPN